MPAMPAKFGGCRIEMSASGDAALHASLRQRHRRQIWRAGVAAHLMSDWHADRARGNQPEHSAKTLGNSSDHPSTEDNGSDRHHSDKQEPTNKNIRHRRLHYGCGKTPGKTSHGNSSAGVCISMTIIPARGIESVFLHRKCNTDPPRQDTRRICCSDAPPGPVARRSACRTDRFLRHPAGIFDRRFYLRR